MVPVRGMAPAAGERAAAFLNALSPAQLSARYDPARTAAVEIYPEVLWTRPVAQGGGTAALAYLLDALGELQAFVGGVATDGDGLLVSVY
jgi:hypothetical protein